MGIVCVPHLCQQDCFFPIQRRLTAATRGIVVQRRIPLGEFHAVENHSLKVPSVEEFFIRVPQLRYQKRVPARLFCWPLIGIDSFGTKRSHRIASVIDRDGL